MSEELLYDYDDEMLQIDLDYFNQFDHLFNDSSGTDSFRFAKPSLDNLQNGQTSDQWSPKWFLLGKHI